jgi:phage-related protein
MAVEVATAYVSIVPTVEGIQKHLAQSLGSDVDDVADKSGKRVGKGFGDSFAKTAAVAMGGAFAVFQGAQFAKGLLDSASDLNETLSKSSTIFGDNADEIEAWGKTAAKNLGQSQQEAINAAATFGNLFSQLGIGGDVTASMSTQMTELASDFASFHNADISEVIEAQTAAFRGEYDALQRFVPTINAAAVEQKALEQTGKKTTKELTAQEKALATHTLMMEGAGAAAGDFQRTSDGAANQQRILSAQFANLRAEIGQRLLPIFTRLVTWFNDEGIPALRRFGGWLEQNVVPILAEFGRILRDTVLPALVGVGEFIIENQPVLIGIIAALAAVFLIWAINAGLAAAATLLALAPVIAITAAIAALVAGVVWAYQNWGWFRDAVDAVASFLTDTLWPALKRIADFIMDEVVPVVSDLIGIWWDFHAAIFRIVGEVIAKVAEIVTYIAGLPAVISEKASQIWEGLKNGLEAVVKWILQQLDKMLGPIDEALAKVNDVVKATQRVGLTSEGTVLRDYVEGRASGGPVRAGMPYVVGEKRPELFVPNSDGYIYPSVGGAGRGITVNLNAVYTDPNPLQWAREVEFLAGFN